MKMSFTENVSLQQFGIEGYFLSILRTDLMHSTLSGNKFWKLKYNLQRANELNKNVLLTFGGAYSNHLVATAEAGEKLGFKTIGVVRGNELKSRPLNATLKCCVNLGMQLYFLSREEYRLKEESDFIRNIINESDGVYVLPEGGTNALAVLGCEEILSEANGVYDYICTAVGTGGTLAGLVRSSQNHQFIFGYSSLKNANQKDLIREYTSKDNFLITDEYSFGGYGKIDSELIRFINQFKHSTRIPLDPIYTGKMIFGLINDLRSGKFVKGGRVLAVHTGGLQGISGMNEILKKKGLAAIE